MPAMSEKPRQDRATATSGARQADERRREALEAIDWGDVAVRLAAYLAMRLGRRASPADVEELASETLCRVFDGEYKDWDPEREPNPFRFCLSVANGLARNFVRRAYRSREVAVPDKLEAVSPGGEPADSSVAARDDARAMELLRRRVEDDEMICRILDLYAEGVEKTRHIAEALGASRSEVHNAKRRLLNHVERVKEMLDEEVSDDVG